MADDSHWTKYMILNAFKPFISCLMHKQQSIEFLYLTKKQTHKFLSPKKKRHCKTELNQSKLAVLTMVKTINETQQAE